jgi:hypothetical protein
MRETTFRFDVRISLDGDGRHEAIKSRLAVIRGVTSIEISPQLGTAAEICVKAVFANGEEAKQVHRKLVKALMGTGGVAISGITTNLTEVFG